MRLRRRFANRPLFTSRNRCGKRGTGTGATRSLPHTYRMKTSHCFFVHLPESRSCACVLSALLRGPHHVVTICRSSGIRITSSLPLNLFRCPGAALLSISCIKFGTLFSWRTILLFFRQYVVLKNWSNILHIDLSFLLCIIPHLFSFVNFDVIFCIMLKICGGLHFCLRIQFPADSHGTEVAKKERQLAIELPFSLSTSQKLLGA